MELRPTLASEVHERRYVFAHYMVCCPRSVIDAHGRMSGQPEVEDFVQEIGEAYRAGIDGFALNCGEWFGHPRYKAFTAKLFEAAKRFEHDFKLFFSADQVTAEEAADMVASYADHPNYFRYQSRPVLSTYDGTPGWGVAIRDRIRARGNDMFFVPYFYPPSRREAPTRFDVRALGDHSENLDGFFYFSVGQDFDGRSTRIHAREWARRNKLFMAGVAPYYRGLRANFRVFDSGGYAGLVNLWTAAIETRAAWVELVTWNDWEEATYFAPLGTSNEVSRSTEWWGLLLSHDGYLKASRYFIDWFKRGQRPEIATEQLYYAYRLHRHDVVGKAVPTEDRLSAPVGAAQLVDRIFILAILRDAADLSVAIDGKVTTSPLRAGINQLSVPMRDGRPKFKLTRSGITIAEKQAELPIDLKANNGNFNIVAGEVGILK